MQQGVGGKEGEDKCKFNCGSPRKKMNVIPLHSCIVEGAGHVV